MLSWLVINDSGQGQRNALLKSVFLPGYTMIDFACSGIFSLDVFMVFFHCKYFFELENTSLK